MKKYVSMLLFSLFLTGTATYSQTLKNNDTRQVKMQLGFIENKGQVIDQNNELNTSVKYLLNMPGLNVQLKANSFSYDAYIVERHKKDNTDQVELPLPNLPEQEDITLIFQRIDIEFIGANSSPKIIAEEAGSDYLNYFTTGTREEGVTFVKHYGKVTYIDLYPGIDLVFFARPGTTKPVEFNFIVHPGADLSLIQWKYQGSQDVKLTDGIIQIKTAHGLLNESIPKSFEEETNKEIKICYKRLSEGKYAFEGIFDSKKTLVIDPLPNLFWATYYGGSGNDQTYGVSYDNSGNVYITGEATTTTNIATTGTHQSTYAGGTVQYGLGGDAIIVKFSPTGTRLWGTYFGGSGEDLGYAIKINSSSEIYISGNTNSAAGIATTGAFQTVIGGTSYHDAMLAKFSTAGIRLWATYFGGSGNDRAYFNGLALDASGNVYMTGTNNTANSSSITTAGCYKSTNGSTSAYDDPFVAKFSPTGTIIWGTYYGGPATGKTTHDQAYCIAVDASNNVYIGGNCNSTTDIATAGAHQTTHGGGTNEGFLAKLNSTGTALLWATYYGGSLIDVVSGIAVDANQNVYIAGYTSSTSGIATTGAYQTTNAGGTYDGFLAKFNSSGTRQWGTYFGGTDVDVLYGGLNVNSNGDIVVGGYSASTSGIATTGTYQTTYGGGTQDAVIAKFSPAGNLLWGTYYGGALQDILFNSAVDPGGNIYVAGRTLSTNGIASAGAFQTTNGGGTMDGLLGVFQDVVVYNDAGIASIDKPASPMVPGIDTVKVTLKNFGKNNLTSVDLRWSINGVAQTNPASWTGSLAQNSAISQITLGGYNFSTGMYNIKAWTKNPNGISDSNAYNDTARFTLISCHPANGSYVVDPTGSGDFKTFNEALSWLKSCGVAGPVTFRVKPGTYTEQLTIPAISGASATNKIIFESYNLDSNGVILTYAAAGTADNWVVRFNGCSYITFRKMSIVATGAANGVVVEYITGSNNCMLESNVIRTLVTSLSTYSGVYSSTTADQYNTIKNNLIIGGYNGIYWYGVSTTSFELGNVIEGNTVRDYYYYGIVAYHQDAVKIRKNTIITSTASATVYGIMTYYCNNSIEITQNNVQITANGTIYPLTLSSDAGTASLRGNVSNNFISTVGAAGTTIYGIYISSSSYHDLNCNSVNLTNPNGTSRALFITTGTTSTVNVQNNNFVNSGGGYAIYTGSATTALGTCNYNNLFTTGTNLGYWTSNNGNLAAWRTASSKDAASISVNPGYWTSTDLHANSASLNGAGTVLSGLTVDFDGETRQNPPDIGADEFDLNANDAGITVMAGPLPPCPGLNYVSVKIKNNGTVALTSVTIGWSVNGITQTPLTPTLSLSQNSDTTLILGAYTFAIGNSYNFKFWTSQPNGVADGNVKNDTFVYKNLATAFGGNYTIGGATADYANLIDAIAALQAKGICSATNFKINKGTYTGRIVIPVINGTSATNRITFDGKYADSVKITYAGTSAALSTVLFNGADYITFKNVTIENTGTTYGYAGCFIGQADYNTIDSCKILLDQTSTAATIAGFISTNLETSVSGLGNNANYVTISNCSFKGGYYGIRFNGTSTSVKCTNNSVINCTFDRVYYYGIYFYYQTYPTFLNNYLAGFRSTTCYGIYNYYGGMNPIINWNTISAYYGIYNYYYNYNSQIIGNTILNAYSGIYNYYYNDNSQIFDNIVRASYMGIYNYYYNTSTNIERNDINGGYMGIYCYYENYSGGDSSSIINNMIRQGGNTSYPYGYGVNVVSSARLGIYHNTLQTDSVYSSTVTSYGTLCVKTCTGPIKIKNNIIKSIGNMPCFTTDGTNIAAGNLDFNLYYTVTTGNLIAYWGTTSYTSFIVWKSSMPTFNRNSLHVDPELVSKYNLHLKTGSTFNRGIPLGVDRDVDNDYRCLPVPTIGADEFVHPYDKPDADFSTDSVNCINSPYTFLNKAGINEPKRHFWFIDSVYKSSSINFTYNFTTQGLKTITLITQNCSTTDTVTKKINIGLATKAPQSYFVVNKNKVEVNEPVTLSDISLSCPENWKWTVSPDSFFDPTAGYNICTYQMAPGADTTQSPQISFNYPGIYSVCLTTANSIGAGTKYCLNDYIEVLPAVRLCYAPFESKEKSGSIYDDGGNAGQYSNNKKCGFMIHPCAKTVSLVFTTFDVIAGDYIRIYDGPDNKSTPMWNPVIYPSGINNNYSPPSATDTFVAKSGSMYIEIITDAGGQGNGISAKWFSESDSYAPTHASFEIPDTICNGVPTTFHNTSTGVQNDYFWYFDNSGAINSSAVNGVYKYTVNGNYLVKLFANGCGGVDSFAKNIYVQTILAKPDFELLASNNSPNAYSEIITISQNTLKNCIDTTIWDISPKSYTLISGQLDNSQTISIKFEDTVCYDFTVIGKYHGYSDTVYYPCFIKPVNYCKPFVAYLSSDIGISRVRLNTIDKSSSIGAGAYSDFTGTESTDLERGATYNITIDRYTTSNPMNRKVWIDYNRDGIFNSNTEMVANEPSAITLSWTGSFTLPKNVDLGVVRMRLGATLGNSSNNPCGTSSFGEYEDYMLHIVRDKTNPVMSLIGPPVIHVIQCSGGYFDPGVVVTDNADTNLADSVKLTGIVDQDKFGTYIVTYNVKDNAGNAAIPLTRTIIVDPDSVSPEIYLVGNPVQIIQIFSSYTDSGYIAFDTCSGLDKVVSSTNLDTANIGTFSYTYKAFDLNGNTADVTRTIVVTDTVDPVITSISNDTILLNIYNILPNPVYTVTDNYYQYYDIDVIVKGTYYQTFPNGQATIPGFYTFIYLATDGSGNSDSISFIINVLDKVKPVITLKGDIFYTICRFDTLEDPGYTVKDNYDPNPKVVKSGTYITEYMPIRMVGNYELIYTVTDNSGNWAATSRFINVTDEGVCHNTIKPDETQTRVKLYPNPGNGKFEIEFGSTVNEITGISIYDAIGNIVYHTLEQITPGQVKTFEHHDFKPGIYFIKLTQGDKITMIKYNLIK